VSALRAWLRQNRLAARPLRAAVSLLLAVVLVAGGASFAERAVGGEAAPSAVVEGQSHVAKPAPAALRDGEHLLRAASVARGHDVTPRWLDLRSGGLPAPRAPDAVAAPRFGC
jgi:hypothetical protein